MLDPETKLKLLILGVDVDKKPLRQGGGGPLGGIGFKINESVVSAPAIHSYAKKSPFKIRKIDEVYYLLYKDDIIGKVDFPEPKYYGMVVGGVPAEKLVALDGYDTLVSALSRKCIHWEMDRKCIFCSIQNNVQKSVVFKDPEKLAMAVKIAYEEDKNRHLTLTTGTINLVDKGAKKMVEAVRAIKNEVDIPIHVQLEPINRYWLEKLYESGADTIGIHVEVFDEQIRNKVIPGKPPLSEYFESWRLAVDLFGEWNVSSWLLTGLGENIQSVIEGFKKMTEMTVFPFIAPYRPPPFTSSIPPELNYNLHIQKIVLDEFDDVHLKIPEFKSGCPRCGGCSFIPEILYK